ncbi:MAG: helix-turn-helix domain-containing protein, partial [bacterium]|nr:helix-turn-helix domain-containing protein [bacterium]
MITKTPPEKLPPLGFRVADIAKALRLPRSTVYRLVRTGELPAVRIRGIVLVLADDLSEFLT